ncbi:MAG: hypothetical protein JWO25_3573 [Alphaproteobacteria bacterium]|nr:hypothetical protein [Alphaproteobacteria bacterium]
MAVAGATRLPLLRAVGDWLTERARDPELRDEMIASLIQRRPSVFISSVAIMAMSVAAAFAIGAPWTLAWLTADLVLLAGRLHLSFRYDRGGQGPSEGRGAVVMLTYLILIIFGAGCSALIATGPILLFAMAMISMMGVFVGLVSRWAAFPRLALLAIGLVAAMVGGGLGVRTGGGLPFALFQFLLILGTTGAQTLQNHNTLLRMLRAERRNWLMARSDSLTGLGNRVSLVEAIESICAKLHADPTDPARHFALFYLDLDGFKAINDNFGHEAGDRLLASIAAVLTGLVTPRGTAFRVGGDEFVILAEGGLPAAAKLAGRIIAAIPACQAEASRRRVTASIGITIASADRADPRILLAEADAALYFAKGRGKSCWHLHGSEPTPLARAG